jgi:predicted N-acetyltransferase YhbS
MSTARFRRDYADDPTLSDRVFELLETWFIGIQAPRRVAAQLGSLWDHCSTPFVAEKNGQIISHVGLLNVPYVIHGERKQLGGVHAVCTLEAERRQGHFRGLMEEMLAYCEGRYRTLELSTEHPEYYEPFGFRTIPEHRFVKSVDASGSEPGKQGFRPFDIASESDLALLDRLLDQRTQVSNIVGFVRERDIFKFSQGVEGLHYCEALDCLAVFDLSGSRLSLLDVVAVELPSLEALLAQIPGSIHAVEFYFSPERFTEDARPEVYRYDTDYFMVRGPFAAEKERFMVPRSARH